MMRPDGVGRALLWLVRSDRVHIPNTSFGRRSLWRLRVVEVR